MGDSTKRQQKDKNGRSLENMMEELDMDAYDEEEVEERLFGVGTYYGESRACGPWPGGH